MPLVNYSSDSSSDNADVPPLKKQKVTQRSLPPLPSNFRDLYATPVRASKVDDPSLHAGRQRVNPHVEGSWPTHVYTEWIPSDTERESIKQLIQGSSPAGHGIHDLLMSDLGAPAPLHISLSCSLGLSTEKRDEFADRLKAAIEQASVHAFEVRAIDLRWVPNFTKSRWFLVLHLEQPPKDELNQLLKASNQVATSFGFPCLYTKATNDIPSKSASVVDQTEPETLNINTVAMNDGDMTINPFHISIAWSLSQPPMSKDADILGYKTSDAWRSTSKLEIKVDAVKVKIGNSILTFELRSAPSLVKAQLEDGVK